MERDRLELQKIKEEGDKAFDDLRGLKEEEE